MNIKSYRNVLATTTLAAFLLAPTVTNHVFAADDTQAQDQEQEQESLVTTTTEVYIPETPKVNNVKSLTQTEQSVPSIGEFNNIADAVAAVINENKKFTTNVKFTYTGNTSDISNFWNVWMEAIHQPGNDYVYGTYAGAKNSVEYKSDGTITMSITFKYFATAEQEAYNTEQIKKIAASLTKEGMSDFDKVLAVNNYVVTHTLYSKSAKTTPHNIYAYLKEGKAVCQAYALLTYRLLDEMGVENRYVTGTSKSSGIGHAWNLVKVDGNWYYLDTTWNDPLTINSLLPNISYEYFLVTGDRLAEDHEWDIENYPEANDDSYSYMHKMTHAIEYNGDIYYSDSSTGYLNKFNSKTKEITQLLDDRAYYLAAFNDKIYFSDYSNGAYLTSYDLTTGKTEIIDETFNCKDLIIVDDILQYKANGKAKTYELPLTEDQQKVKTVKNAIKSIKTTSKTFIDDVANASKLYEDLDDNLKDLVTNYSTLEDYESQIENAKPVYEAIKALDGSSIEAIEKARTDYDALNKAEKKYVTNLATLTKQESSIKNVLAALKAIKAVDPSSSNFVTQVTTARKAIDKVSSQLDLIKDNKDYVNFLSLEKRATAIDLITKLKSTSANYIAEVEAANEAFNQLTDDEKNNVSQDLQDKLEQAVEAIKPAQAVVTTIAALEDEDTSIQDIIDARAAYNALGKVDQKYVTNLAILTKKENDNKNVIAAINAIDAIDPTNSKTFVSKVTTVSKAVDKTGDQRDSITNIEKFEALKAQANVFDLISKLNPSSAKYIEDVKAADTAFKALADDNKEYVKNADDLTKAVETVEAIEAVVDLINDLGDDATVKAITEARNAYNELNKTVQKHVTNLSTLTAKENNYKNVIAAINAIKAIDPASKNFASQVATARKAVDKTGDQEGLITNLDEFKSLEAQATAIDLITKLKSTSANFIKEVEVANEAFGKLTDEEKQAVSQDLQQKLTDAMDAIDPAKAIVEQISDLTEDKITVATVKEARAAYNALSATDKKYVYNLKDLTNIENQLKNVINAITAIEAIDPSSSTFITKVKAARTAYDKAGEKQNLVTNSEKFLAFEAQANVIDLITKLKSTSTKYIAEVETANEAFEKLADDNKQYVTQTLQDKLTQALSDIQPAKEVVKTIADLENENTTAQDVIDARAAYNKLSTLEKKYITNLAVLTKYEKQFVAEIKAINLISTTKATDVSTSNFMTNALNMKKAYTALNDTQKAQISSDDLKDYEYYVALYEIKNAQKTRNWTNVSLETFETLEITNVTSENLDLVITGFNSLKAGTGTSTVEEIQQNINSFQEAEVVSE